ncbi:MAG: NAD-binding protein, partial [Bacteroidota bacterium]
SGLVFSGFIIAGRFLTIVPSSYHLKLGTRVGILSAIALSQSSEFSLVIATIGYGYGHISQETVSLIAITLVVTSTSSTYMIMGSHGLARGMTGLLERVGIRSSHLQDEAEVHTAQGEIVILGCHRLGSSLVHILEQGKERGNIHVFDFNPVVLSRLKARGIKASYVDVSHFDALDEAGIHDARVIICTLPDDFLRGTSNEALLKYLRSRETQAKIVVYANSAADALRMYEGGADFVLLPHSLSAHRVAEVIDKGQEGGLEGIREGEMEELRNRDEVLP